MAKALHQKPSIPAWGAIAALNILTPAYAANPEGRVVIDLAAGPTARFDPKLALGAALDGLEEGEVARLFTAHNLARIKAAHLGPISYRLRTELGVEAWHWSEEGAWSDPAHRQGYWVSSDEPKRPVLVSNGYNLPRRGDTIDQADNNGFSRLDDGDPATFWKSNPYLDPLYVPDAPARPQWVVVEFDDDVAIDAARIDWAAPFARRYQVQYWVGVDDFDRAGRWVTFPGGKVENGAGGQALLTLAPAPITAQFFRVLLEESSHTPAAGGADPRDAMGYAIAELHLGLTGPDGRFIDAVQSGRSVATQTQMHVSSTDPWHRASDLDPSVEQPGFDRIYASGLTRGLPMMVPVGVLYDIPENAAAEISFLRKRGYPARQVELGEEPDGQLVDAEDFASLYVQVAASVRRADPQAITGGPSLQQAVADTWLDSDPNRSWTSRFIRALESRGHLSDLGFFSFERYPVESLCGPVDAKLRQATLAGVFEMDRLRRDGVPSSIPWIITEFGYSPYNDPAELRIPAALIDADIAAAFLQSGGAAAYLYGITPGAPSRDEKPCAKPGGLFMFRADDAGRAREALPAYYAARMLAQDWAGPAPVTLFQASYDLKDDAGRPWVTAYPARRPDGRWSILLVNRDPRHARAVRISLHGGARGGDAPLTGPVRLVEYGAAQFAWSHPSETNAPSRDRPPLRRRLASANRRIWLPAYSLTVVTSLGPGGGG